ncbi:hypothetical protein DERP_000226 [Dermatophagoides pteronyssinus]|uniref:Uncharacterized protein n=1 Tax=Dermatophagoides pteronyssinus TaxID=6956 RepID=A0ABQ8IZN6_DERPT|nr:hypothetical protein DERP_000226 [Dermatophagoides pteronyssinus]
MNMKTIFLFSICLACFMPLVSSTASNSAIQLKSHIRINYSCESDLDCPGMKVCRANFCFEPDYDDGVMAFFLTTAVGIILIIIGSIINCVIWCFACVGCYHCCCENRSPAPYAGPIVQMI